MLIIKIQIQKIQDFVENTCVLIRSYSKYHHEFEQVQKIPDILASALTHNKIGPLNDTIRMRAKDEVSNLAHIHLLGANVIPQKDVSTNIVIAFASGS